MIKFNGFKTNYTSTVRSFVLPSTYNTLANLMTFGKNEPCQKKKSIYVGHFFTVSKWWLFINKWWIQLVDSSIWQKEDLFSLRFLYRLPNRFITIWGRSYSLYELMEWQRYFRGKRYMSTTDFNKNPLYHNIFGWLKFSYIILVFLLNYLFIP